MFIVLIYRLYKILNCRLAFIINGLNTKAAALSVSLSRMLSVTEKCIFPDEMHFILEKLLHIDFLIN